MNARPASYPVYLRPILILSSHLNVSLSSGHFPFGISNNISYMLGWHIRACHEEARCVRSSDVRVTAQAPYAVTPLSQTLLVCAFPSAVAM